MSQKKKVRVYQPGGQIANPMANWFMQMGGVPQQPQQDDMMNQVMVYAQQMIMEGEDPNNVYDDLVTQGVPSHIAAQVVEQIVDSTPAQPSYSQPTTAEAMYNQEVEEEEEEAGPDFMNLAGLYDDEDDDDFEDFQKGGMTKKKFVKEYKKLALGGEKPEEVSKIKSTGFLGAVENTFKNAKAEQEAEQMFNNPFAVNALSQFVYGGSLPKAQDGAFTKEEFDKYVKEQADRYKQLEERYKQLEQRSNQGYVNNTYGYGQGYGPGYGRGYGYGNVPTMFNPYGRRDPIFQRTPYLKNFPGADFAGMQLQDFKIDTKQVDRNKLFKFLGPKTQQTWSATWSRNPVTGKIEPTKPGTTTTSPVQTSAPINTTTTPNVINTEPGNSAAGQPGSTTKTAPGYFPGSYGPGFSGYDADVDGSGIPAYLRGTPSMQFGGYRFQPGGNVFDMNDEEIRRYVPERMTPIMPEYGDLMAATPGLANPTIDENFIMTEEPVKNAWTVDIPALYDDTMYYTKSFLNESQNKRDRENYLTTFLDNATRGNEQYGFRGNYTTNQLSNSSNFRPDLDGQIQYSQYGGPVVGEELEMTEEEIKKFLKGGGKLRYV
jgi:hypothetical protein